MKIFHGFKTQKDAKALAGIVNSRFNRTVQWIFSEADRAKHVADIEGLKLPSVLVLPTNSDLIPDRAQKYRSGMITRLVKSDPAAVDAQIIELCREFGGQEVAK